MIVFCFLLPVLPDADLPPSYSRVFVPFLQDEESACSSIIINHPPARQTRSLDLCHLPLLALVN